MNKHCFDWYLIEFDLFGFHVLNSHIVDAKKIAIDNSTATTKFASNDSKRVGFLSFSAARMI